jgi:hypothetical protein
MRRFLKLNGLTLFFLALFLLTMLGQSAAGYFAYNEEQVAHGSAPYSFARYLLSSNFAAAISENWESEFLQFVTFIVASVWLIQKGSPDSKDEDEIGLETDEEQRIGEYARRDSPRWAKAGGWLTRLYSNSLLIVFGFFFLASWAAQSLSGWSEFNDEQRDHDEATVSYVGYLGNADFWEKTLQNWQSEFLAVGCFVLFTVYLRQRGSPESKPVGAPHDATGTTG